MHHSVRRAAALVAAPALATLALVATPPSASAAVDDNPALAAAGWLAMQPVDGLVTYDSGGYSYTDFGGSIDLARFLLLVGSQQDTVDDIADGLAANIEDYITGEQWGDMDSTYVGPTAKAAVLAQSTGSATDFGGVDLIQRLEVQVSDEGAALGRMHDTSTYGDNANVFGQSFAAQALAAADSDQSAAVTGYLLAQQCADGSFKETLPAADGATQTCADASGAASIDATATAVMALQPQADDDAAVKSVIDKAVTWLEGSQLADGAFSTDGEQGANANATGLATTAIAIAADGVATPAVTQGAIWVRQHQVHYQDACAPFAASASGAIAYSDADRTTGMTAGITTASYGTWFQATAQAAPALLWAPKGDGANVLFSAEYVKAGGTKQVGVNGADPGEQLCAVLGKQKVVGWADANGEASFPVKISTRTATSTVAVYAVESQVGTASIKALGAKKLAVAAPAKVRTGKTLRVVIRGLAPAESVKVSVLGKVKRGQATRKGVFVAAAKVTGKPRKARVAVVGAFGNRTGVKTVKVVR